jgi:hypothetical protein
LLDAKDVLDRTEEFDRAFPLAINPPTTALALSTAVSVITVLTKSIFDTDSSSVESQSVGASSLRGHSMRSHSGSRRVDRAASRCATRSHTAATVSAFGSPDSYAKWLPEVPNSCPACEFDYRSGHTIFDTSK